MKLTKIIPVLAVCALASGTVFGVSAIEQSNSVQEVSTLSYASAELEQYAEQVAILVNQERVANGLNPVRFSPQLSEAAIIRAEELPKSFSHTRPNGTSCFTAMTELGISYRAAAENIAYGQKNPESVMNAWMNSSGHRANILSENMDYIGVGVVYQNGMYYWSQFFAASDQLYDGSYLPGENGATTTTTTTPVTTTVQTTTTVKNTTTETTTSVPEVQTTTVSQTSSDKPAETTSTTLPDVTTSQVTSTEPPSTTVTHTTTASSESTSVTTKEESPVVSDTETVTSVTTTTTECSTIIDPDITTISLGDNCSGIGVGVIIFNGSY